MYGGGGSAGVGGGGGEGELMAGWLVKSPPLDNKKPIFKPVTPVSTVVLISRLILMHLSDCTYVRIRPFKNGPRRLLSHISNYRIWELSDRLLAFIFNQVWRYRVKFLHIDITPRNLISVWNLKIPKLA